MKILHLTLHRRWFDLIALGKKKEEFRLKTPYWRTRLHGREYDEIHFRNGYHKRAPFMRVRWRGIQDTPDCYMIRLGRVLSIKHWKKPPPPIAKAYVFAEPWREFLKLDTNN